MSIGTKTLVAVMALAIFVLAALPAVASAQPSVHSTEKHFTVTGGAFELKAPEGNPVPCMSVTGTGEYEGTSPFKTGTIQFLFHGCKPFGFANCTSPGQSAGTITTEMLPFHLVTATKGGVAKNAVLITPNANGTFMTFNCSFLVHALVKGNGLIAEITTPTNTLSSTLGLKFAADPAVPGTQDLQVVCGLAGTWDLVVTVNGAEQTAALVGTLQTHLTNGLVGTLT